MELLRFKVGPDVFALPIERVVQIIDRRPVTRVPGVAACIVGVFNHEGEITPLVDPGRKFEIASTASARTSIVIVSADHDGDRVNIGLLVDCVVDVVNVDADQIEATPAFGIRFRLDYLAGLTRIREGFTFILDVDRFLNTSELLDLAIAREKVPA